MKRVISLFFLLFLTGCVQDDVSSYLSEEEIVEAFNEHNHIQLTKVESSKEEIFATKLNGVKPGIYELEENRIYIYEFDSPDKLEKGKEDFLEKTASMNLVSYNLFEKRNLLLFYVHGEDIGSKSIPFKQEIREALDRMIEG